jgi:hypothetical protein
VGLIAGTIALGGFAACGLDHYMSSGSWVTKSSNCTPWAIGTAVSFVIGAAALAVGIPLIVIGHRAMKRARLRAISNWLPTMELALGDERRLLRARWRF